MTENTLNSIPGFESQILVFMSIPGAGKGTQSKMLDKYYKNKGELSSYIGTGNMLRELKEDSLLSEIVKEKRDSGKLVPDLIIYGLIMERLSKLPRNQRTNVIFDGYPRNLAQAREFQKTMKDFNLNNIIIVEIKLSDKNEEKEALRRMLGRGEEERRTDDKRETILQRIETYKTETVPAINYLEDCYMKVVIDGSKGIQDVFEEIVNKISSLTTRSMLA